MERRREERARQRAQEVAEKHQKFKERERLAKEAAEARLLEEKKRLKRQQEMRREKLKQDEAKAVTLKKKEEEEYRQRMQRAKEAAAKKQREEQELKAQAAAAPPAGPTADAESDKAERQRKLKEAQKSLFQKLAKVKGYQHLNNSVSSSSSLSSSSLSSSLSGSSAYPSASSSLASGESTNKSSSRLFLKKSPQQKSPHFKIGSATTSDDVSPPRMGPPSESYELTPDKVRLTNQPNLAEENYDISHIRSDDSTDDDETPRQKIPSWAQGAQLKAALHAQYHSGTDADALFPQRLTCDLGAIFTFKKKTFNKRRGSSAVWTSTPLKAYERED